MSNGPKQTDPLSRLARLVLSQVTARIFTVLSVLIAIAGWVTPLLSLKVLLGVQAVLILLLAGLHAWTSQAYLRLRRANSRSMDDPAFFERFKVESERSILALNDELAEGHPKVYASEVPKAADLLLQILIDASTAHKEVLATDLTTAPQLLSKRRRYREMNAKLIEAGGTIRRVFICWADKLVDESYARQLMSLVEEQRGIGVHCGLAVHDLLDAEHEADFVVFARSAVMVEDKQADEYYRRGQSTVNFRRIDQWVSRFWSIWGVGKISADAALARYEKVVGPMLAAGEWDEAAVRRCVDEL